jgi:acetyltransferase-like isoleucine patch superfamily enzyme
VLRKAGIEIDPSVVFYGTPIFSIVSGSKITIGPRSVLCSDPRYTALGVNHAVVLRTLSPIASIHIGADTGISGASICSAASIIIGNNVLLGANVTILDTDFHAVHPVGRRYNINPNEIAKSPVTIGDNVFIGAGSFVLKGSEIGINSVIGAGSVVTNIVPSNVIAAGNPACIIRKL